MRQRFSKHYTRAEAEALLPQIRDWLASSRAARDAIAQADSIILESLNTGSDLGGDLINNYLRAHADLQAYIGNFSKREIQVKDLDRGLIDFPAIIEGREVFLCWEEAEDHVEFWHDIEAGYAGRERLDSD